MKTRFYEFTQNNSGGYFDVDENVTNRVYIEATSKEEAVDKMETFIVNQSSSCPCCGDRWSTHYAEEVELSEWRKKGYPVSIYTHHKDYEGRYNKMFGGFTHIEKPYLNSSSSFPKYQGRVKLKNIEEYAQMFANMSTWCSPNAIIHYQSGEKKNIYSVKLD